MADDLVVVGFVFVFFQKIVGAGKSNLIDIFFHFIRSHAEAVVGNSQRFCIGIYFDFDLWFVIGRKLILSHHIQFF